MFSPVSEITFLKKWKHKEEADRILKAINIDYISSMDDIVYITLGGFISFIKKYC